MFKKAILLFIILTSVSFYTLIFVPDGLIGLLRLAIPAGMLFMLLVYGVYDDSFRFRPRFRFEFILIYISVVLSMFGAYYFHKQGFAVTAVAQRFIYFVLFYPFLHILKPKPEFLIKVMVVLGIFYAFLYISQILVYPAKLVSSNLFMDRKTLRIGMPGSGFLMLAYFIGLSRLFKTNQFKYFLLCLLTFTVITLMGTRQVIAPVAIATVLSILFSKKVKSRVLIIILVAIAVIPVYFLFIDIFNAMFDVSQKQATNYKDDIRVKAATFFIFEFFPNKWSYIIGNGVPSALSPYGLKMNAFAKLLGYFQSDIGIIGDFSKFGILMVIAQISLYVRVMIMKIPVELDFLKYNFLIALLAIVFGSSFGYADFIVIICISLYIIDTSSHFSTGELKTNITEHTENENQILTP
jgi:hypothetical protein